MNKFKATITKIQSVDNLNIVNFDFGGQGLSMMSLDLNEKIKVGTQVLLTAKPTHIAIAKEFSGDISYSNQLDAKIVEINNGELLSSIKLSTGDATCESIITKNSSLRMKLKKDDKVLLFIKASELSIKEVLSC
ncbi:TOBE domain-containing protein [Sulfurimonas sp.]|uniref:TOBE domain-containing protein n=1 Tax=Sulfurimonas sp. TaxID=2022749 RepID=UPI0025D9385D|nr:TOBE domain-containing protein [Sulfurimonas sp.]